MTIRAILAGGAVIAAVTVAAVACTSGADDPAALPEDWLNDVGTETLPELLAHLSEESIFRVSAILTDETDPGWRERLQNGTLIPRADALDEATVADILDHHRALATADVTTPLSDIELKYLNHKRASLSTGYQEVVDEIVASDPAYDSCMISAGC